MPLKTQQDKPQAVYGQFGGGAVAEEAALPWGRTDDLDVLAEKLHVDLFTDGVQSRSRSGDSVLNKLMPRTSVARRNS